MSVGKDVILGKNVVIHHPELVNLYGCRIGDDSSIGAFVEIKNTVNVGKKVKVQAGVFIPEGVTIEDEVFIGPHACFTNDLYPRATNEDGTLKSQKDWKVTLTLVKRGASIGANVTIRCGVTIGKESMIGAGSVVISDIPDFALAVGNPAKVIGPARDKK